MEKGYEFLVDSREKERIVKAIVKRRGIPHRVTALAAGDFALRNLNIRPVRTVVGIERKSIQDFVQSVQSRRIFEQCNKLDYLYDISYLMISGNIADYMAKMQGMKFKVNTNVIYGTIASLSVKSSINILWLPDDVTLVDIAYRICEKISEGKYQMGLKSKPKYLGYSPKAVLITVPGVTSGIADRLLSKFGSLKVIACTEETRLTVVPGVGDAMAKKIKYLFEKKYK